MARPSAAITVVLLVVLLGPGARAEGASGGHDGFRDIGSATSPYHFAPVATDGRRFAAFHPTLETTRVLDTRRGRSFVVPNPAEGCRVTAAGAGQVVWTCEDERGAAPVLLDARTRQVRRAPGLDALRTEVDALRRRVDGGPPSIVYDAVGRRWIEARVELTYVGSKTFSLYSTVHLDRFTGERRYDTPRSPRSYPDLDRPGLTRRLCRPVARTRGENGSGNAPDFEPFVFEGGIALDDDPSEQRLLLERCGRRPVVLSRCRTASGCYSPQLAGGLVSWAERRAAFLYDASSGRRVRATPAAARRNVRTGGCPRLAVAHTRMRLLVSRSLGPPDAGGVCRWRVHSRGL